MSGVPAVEGSDGEPRTVPSIGEPVMLVTDLLVTDHYRVHAAETLRLALAGCADVSAEPGGGHELRAHENALASYAQVHDGEHRQRVPAAAYPEGAHDKALARLPTSPLLPCQLAGALFGARNARRLG